MSKKCTKLINFVNKKTRNIRRANVCRFVEIDKTGDYDPLTDRFDGAIGDLMAGNFDMFFRSMEYGGVHPKYVVRISVA